MSRPFISVFGIADEKGEIGDEPVSVSKVAKAACKQGYGVVPLPPGSKVPNICTLTAQELKAAGPKHRTTSGECGVFHVMTDPTVAARVFARIQKKFPGEPLNIGVVAGPSRLINIDADTAEEVQAFQNDWATAEDDPGYLAASPTCLSPGAFRNQEWKHSNGGHFYFTVPEHFDWESYAITSFKAPGGYEVRWGMQMTVVPPSVRAEGAYRPLGDIPEAPAFLLAAIEERNAKIVANRDRHAEVFADDNIAAWSARTSWSDLLIPDEWTDTSRIDKCGCPIFEKPGGGSTTFKSATGHENTCARWENVEGHGPLHLWTTDPPAPLDSYLTEHGQTITKLRYVALTQFHDNVQRAKVELGILKSGLSDWEDSLTDLTPLTEGSSGLSEETSLTGSDDHCPEQKPRSEAPSEPVLTDSDNSDDLEPPRETESSESSDAPSEAPVNEPRIPKPQDFIDSAMSKFHAPESARDMVEVEAERAILNRIGREAAEDYLRAITGNSVESVIDLIDAFAEESDEVESASVPDILSRSDGPCLYHRGRTNYLSGARGAGKTWLAIYTTMQVLIGGGSVIYFDFEDRWALFRERMLDMGFDPTPYKKSGQLVWINVFPTNPNDLPGFIARVGKADLVVFDVINRMVTRLGGSVNNSNDEVIWLTDNLFDPIAATDTCVLILDHPKGEGQRRDAEVEMLNPGGGTMKGNNASGMMMGMKVVKPFTRANPAGHVRLLCLKDRTGHYAEYEACGEFRGAIDLSEDTGTLALSLVVDPPGEDPFASGGIEADMAKIKERVLDRVKRLGPASMGDLKATMTTRLRPLVEPTVEEMVEQGDLVLGESGKYEVAP
jgi:hypothetical protein